MYMVYDEKKCSVYRWVGINMDKCKYVCITTGYKMSERDVKERM
jgi:hypothetical protein